ncbi:MAG: hypothetical protein QOG91_87 [Candidatus Parcubacteria bacterium]|jgi:hypothetical protein|nr:hypothetical protein [Candidatus Parcubacteria bacterium]
MTNTATAYSEHAGKVVEAGRRFKHVMALNLDPRTNYGEGLIRCILSREGDVSVKGSVDRSELHKVKGADLEHFEIGDAIVIKNQDEIIRQIIRSGQVFIGLEDPEIWIDEMTDLLHLYVTLPLIDLYDERKSRIHLGHAVGRDLDSLEMTVSSLIAGHGGDAKELSVAPKNSRGFRNNLFESSKREGDTDYSVVCVAVARDMGKPWTFGDIAFNPNDQGIPWIGGHASPGPLFSENFLDLGRGKRLGVMNGREANIESGKRTLYGMFSVGLFVYDYENGKIDWVSPEPLIRDSAARTITFASQFVETGTGEGVLYAHVDDSFVRAYTLRAEGMKALLPKGDFL